MENEENVLSLQDILKGELGEKILDSTDFILVSKEEFMMNNLTPTEASDMLIWSYEEVFEMVKRMGSAKEVEKIFLESIKLMLDVAWEEAEAVVNAEKNEREKEKAEE